MSSSRPAAVIVLAAGEGTRMRSATPKVLHALCGRTLLGHALDAAAGLAPEHLVVVIGHGRDRVRAVVEAAELPVRTVVQEQQRGTGHAVSCALQELPPLSGTVVVTYGDVPLLSTDTLVRLVEAQRAGAGVVVLSAEPSDPTGYGRILRDRAGQVTGIVEHRDATDEQRAIREVNSGIYAFDARLLVACLGRLSPDNASGELYLTDVVALARGQGADVAALAVDDVWQTEGVNDRVQLARLAAELNRRILEGWMRAGVTIQDPGSTWIDVQVRMDRDVTLRPGVQLLGATAVGRGAEVGPDSTLLDTVVGEQASVVRTHAEQARIGPGATVGPFTYLRPGAVLEEGAKAGAYVEIKSSTVGRDAKVPHLSYVGDATIGAGSNIGAATVFVNYDGVAKHRTSVGEQVRIGSDTMIVAPVTIGDGAYTAAGSVVTKDVPPGAMAVSRAPQRNVEGWVQRRRPGTPSAAAAAAAARGNAGAVGGARADLPDGGAQNRAQEGAR